MVNGELLLGDCILLLEKMPDNHVQCVVTDIPYDNVTRDSNGLRNLDKGKADILTFSLEEFLKQIVRVCSGSFYVFCEFQQISPIDTFFLNNKISTRLIVWEKSKSIAYEWAIYLAKWCRDSHLWQETEGYF